MILITGATGRQGGAVARHLLARGRSFRALTRDPDSAYARKLAAGGAEVVRGDLEDRASLERAMQGVTALFSVQDPWKYGVDGEIRQAKLLADVAYAAGVKHVVYASVAYADQTTGVEHFESKGAIETYMRGLGLTVTATRPVLFMEMLLRNHDRRAPYTLGALRRGLRGKRVQLVAVDDIGRAGADAFDGPADRNIDLAGDELSFDDIMATFERVTGTRPRVVEIPFLLMRLVNHEAYSNFTWIGAHGWRVERSGTAFEPWLRSEFPVV